MPDILGQFINKKKADSEYVSLEDGESIHIMNLREIKLIMKSGFGGEEKEALRLICDVETSEGIRTKKFDNSTQRFAADLQEKNIQLGSSFTITRMGTGVKTRYQISNVKQPADQPA